MLYAQHGESQSWVALLQRHPIQIGSWGTVDRCAGAANTQCLARGGEKGGIAMNASELMQLWDRVRAGLLATIDKFQDQDLDYTAFQGGYSVRQIMLHIAQEELGEIQYGITHTLDEFPSDFQEALFPTISAIKALLAEVHAETTEYLKGTENQDLEGQVEAGWGGSYPLLDMLWHVVEHEVHHRGELSLILGLLGREGLDA
jgi:uncharacterized damage-inducible protein DinB